MFMLVLKASVLALRLQVKYRLLSLLAAMARLAEDREDRLRAALLSLASQHFPAKSSDLCEGSLELTEYTAVWRLLLCAPARACVAL